MTGDLDKLFQAFARDGWGGLEAAGAEARKTGVADTYRETRDREAQIIAKALGDDDGLAAVELLIRKTILRSPTDEERGAMTAERYAMLKAKREGQNDVIFMIMNMLRVAKGEQPQQGGTEP